MATYTVTLINAAGTEITSGDYYVTPVARGALASSSETLKGDGSSDGTIKVSIDITLSYLTLYVYAATAEATDDLTTYEPTGDVLGTSGLLTNSTSGGAVTIQLASVKSSERSALSASLGGIATSSDLASLISADALDLTSLALVASESGDSAGVIAAQAAASVLAAALSSAFSSALGTATTLADSLDEILYGLIRQGQPTTAALLLSQPAAQLEDALNAAIEAGQIDSDLSDQVSTITTALRQTMAWLVQEDGSSPLWTVLGYTSLSDAQKTAFLAEWLTRSEGDATFWDGLTTAGETLTAEQVDELKRVLGLSTITGGDAALVGKLIKDGVDEAADLVAWTTSEWETRLQGYLDTLDVDSDGDGTLDASSFSLPVNDAEAETTLSVAEYAAHLAGQVVYQSVPAINT